MSSTFGNEVAGILASHQPPASQTIMPRGAAEGVPPLVVDLDGTLTPTDTLFEASLKLIKSSPLTAPLMVCWFLTRGRAGLKRKIAERASLNAADLPYQRDLCDWLHSERAHGRKVFLATAADERIALANHERQLLTFYNRGPTK